MREESDGDKFGYLPFTWKNRKFPFGKTNGSRDYIWEASENMSCYLRRCNFSTLFSSMLLIWKKFSVGHSPTTSNFKI